MIRGEIVRLPREDDGPVEGKPFVKQWNRHERSVGPEHPGEMRIVVPIKIVHQMRNRVVNDPGDRAAGIDRQVHVIPRVAQIDMLDAVVSEQPPHPILACGKPHGGEHDVARPGCASRRYRLYIRTPRKDFGSHEVPASGPSAWPCASCRIDRRISWRHLRVLELAASHAPSKSPIDFTAMPYAQHQDDQQFVLNLINDAPIAYSDSPQTGMPRQLHATRRARIACQCGNALVRSCPVRLGQLGERFQYRFLYLKRVRHSNPNPLRARSS